MSDWGATSSWEFAVKGLDQESGAQIDAMLWQAEAFTDRLKAAYADGRLSQVRLSDMVHRILRSIFAVGADQWGDTPAPDMAVHHRIALQIARQGIVLLENPGVLPLSTKPAPRIIVIGGSAQVGVPAGCGSSAVVPPGGYAATFPIGWPGGLRNLYLLPSSPLAELRKLLPEAQIEFDPGVSPAEAALAARRADVAIVFAIRVEGEGFDSVDLSLPWGQDAVIAAVANANSNTVVVLETGNPVEMPWRGSVNAILQAWYPGQAGGQAIAEVIAGQVNPSGRLPITFPVGLDQTPRPELPGLGEPWGSLTTICYDEGAEVGYRWFAEEGHIPMFAFGHGLSYTDFEHRELTVAAGDTVTASFTVVNVGDRAGADIPQLYLTAAAGERRMRLLGFERIYLEPGESRRVTIEADPRLLARYDGAAGKWRIAPGSYVVAVGASAVALELTAEVELAGRVFGR
jgi:beta-glucosidase